MGSAGAKVRVRTCLKIKVGQQAANLIGNWVKKQAAPNERNGLNLFFPEAVEVRDDCKSILRVLQIPAYGTLFFRWALIFSFWMCLGCR